MVRCGFLKIYFLLHVEIPNGRYSGQKLIKEVRTNTDAKTSKTIPSVPVTVPVRYKIKITIAINTLINRSIVPMFAFI